MAKNTIDQNKYNQFRAELSAAKNVEQWNEIRSAGKKTYGMEYVSKVDCDTKTNNLGAHISLIHEVATKNKWPKPVKA